MCSVPQKACMHNLVTYVDSETKSGVHADMRTCMCTGEWVKVVTGTGEERQTTERCLFDAFLKPD